MSNVTKESDSVVLENLYLYGKHDENGTLGKVRGSVFTIQAVPVAFFIIAALVTVSVTIVPHAVSVIVFIARPKVLFTIKAIIEAVIIVAFHVTFTIPKHIPALDCSSAVHPGVDA